MAPALADGREALGVLDRELLCARFRLEDPEELERLRAWLWRARPQRPEYVELEQYVRFAIILATRGDPWRPIGTLVRRRLLRVLTCEESKP